MERSLHQNSNKKSNNIFLIISGISLLITALLLLLGNTSQIGVFVIAIPVSLALFVRRHRLLSVTAFTLWMIASVTAPMFYPAVFNSWYGFERNRNFYHNTKGRW